MQNLSSDKTSAVVAEDLCQEYVALSVKIESFIGVAAKQDSFARAIFRLNQIIEDLQVLDNASKSEIIIGLNFRVRETLMLRKMFSHSK